MVSAFGLTMFGCGKTEHLDVQPEQMVGYWQRSNSQYFYTFNSNGTGNLVNRGETEDGDENTGNFEWTITMDELKLEFRGTGEVGSIDIIKYFTVTEISDTSMKWEDIYGREMTLIKVR